MGRRDPDRGFPVTVLGWLAIAACVLAWAVDLIGGLRQLLLIDTCVMPFILLGLFYYGPATLGPLPLATFNNEGQEGR